MKSQQPEQRRVLKALFLAQKNHFAEHNSYAETFAGLAPFDLPKDNRYAYALGSRQRWWDRTGPLGDADAVATADKPAAFVVPSFVGVKGVCPSCDVVMMAAAALPDGGIDLWSVSTAERMVGGVHVLPGSPLHDSNPEVDF